MVKQGDILYALYGATSGEVGISQIHGAINQAILAIIPNENYDSQFTMQWLRLNKTSIVDKYLQGGQGNLSGAIVKDLEIDFPCFPEQNAIGTFFRTLDNTIHSHQQKLNHLRKLKKGYLQLMFPQDGESVPRIRFEGFTGNWEAQRLGDVAEFSKGSGYAKSDLTTDGTPIILYGRLYTKYETVIENVETFTIMKKNSVISQGGEVIVPSSGETAEDISRASVVSKPGIILGGDLNIVKTSPEISPVFLAITISNGNQQKELSKRAQGKSVVHISNSDLKDVILQSPSIDEQNAIGNFFHKLDSQIYDRIQKLNQLKQLKAAYMQKMFV